MLCQREHDAQLLFLDETLHPDTDEADPAHHEWLDLATGRAVDGGSGPVAFGDVIFVIVAGFLAGTAISILTVIVEHSSIAAGDYALYGNGAIIIPALLAPWALYWGWTWLLGRRDRALEMALFVIGLHFGIGMTVVLDAVFFPQQVGLTPADALPGLLLSGTLFVIPGALLAALTYWLFTTRVPVNAWTIFGAGFLAAVLVVAFWVGLGILTGMCAAAASRDMTRRVPIGVALLILLVVLGNLPYFPGLLGTL